MGNPYIGEIRMFGGSFAPAGWALCNGQLIAISENDALFTLIGTTYGGDGNTTFGLPNLQSRIPMHVGNGHILAETGGAESVTLTLQQLPVHSHGWLASTATASANSPVGNVPAVAQGDLYTTSFSPTNMSPQTIVAAGGSQPHDNMHPYLCINYIISLFGIFPQQT